MTAPLNTTPDVTAQYQVADGIRCPQAREGRLGCCSSFTNFAPTPRDGIAVPAINALQAAPPNSVMPANATPKIKNANG